MLGVPALDAVQTGRDRVRDEPVGAVEGRMRQHRDTADPVDQIDRRARVHLRLGHPGGPALLEEALEGVVEILAMAALDQGAREMGPAGGVAVGQRQDALGGQRDAALVQPVDHVVDAVGPDRLEPGEPRLEQRGRRVEPIAEDVDLVAPELGGELRAGDEFQLFLRAGRGHASAALDGVVVGEGDRREARRLGAPGQLLGRERAVGEMRVRVQVGEHRRRSGPVSGSQTAAVSRPRRPSGSGPVAGSRLSPCRGCR